MKIMTLGGAVFCALLAVLAMPAHAVSLGTLSGTAQNVPLPITITGSWADGSASGPIPVTAIDTTYDGILAPRTSVRFDFTNSAGTLSYNSKTLTLGGVYDGYVGPVHYNGGTTDTWTHWQPLATYQADGTSWGGYKENPTSGDYMTLALLDSSIFVDTPQHASITITNRSQLTANFWARLQTTIAFFLASGFTATYSLASLDAVPLPAALPLFGFSLAGLATARRMRKR